MDRTITAGCAGGSTSDEKLWRGQKQGMISPAEVSRTGRKQRQTCLLLGFFSLFRTLVHGKAWKRYHLIVEMIKGGQIPGTFRAQTHHNHAGFMRLEVRTCNKSQPLLKYQIISHTSTPHFMDLCLFQREKASFLLVGKDANRYHGCGLGICVLINFISVEATGPHPWI